MINPADQCSVIFRCPPELDGILPRPIPAVRGLPDWFKALPQKAFSQTMGDNIYTMKKCPPVIDAMTYGFLMPLACDLKVENGTHPINRDDLPFTTLTGLVDVDLYSLAFVHFPARWRDPAFNGTLAKGTPVAQCLPIRRESWVEQFETVTGATAARFREMGEAVAAGMGLYRQQFRAPKR